MKTLTYSQRYNLPLSFFETISDKERIKTLIKDIKADKNINIEVERFIYQSNFYPQLENKLKSQRAELAGTDDYAERLKLNEQIQETEHEITKYKIGIVEISAFLYELKEENLVQVKRSFFAGNIIEATACLNSKSLSQTQSFLLRKLEIEQELEEVYEKLVDNANEYLIKAQLTSLNLEIQSPADRISKAIEFFKKGKVSAERSRKEEFRGSYYFSYGHFLQRNNLFEEAIDIYQQTLKTSRALALLDPAEYLLAMANTLTNLSVLLHSKKEVKASELYGMEALNIYRALVKQNLYDYLPEMATTLNNLGNLHRDKKESDIAEKEYQEALSIRRALAKRTPDIYLPDVAQTLNNLANLHSDKNEIETSEQEYLEALGLYRTLAIQKPSLYLSYVAMCLNNLGQLHTTKNEIELAEYAYLEALELYRELTRQNPSMYLPYMGTVLNNLGVLHKDKDDLKASELELQEALAIRRTLAKHDSSVYLPDVAQTLINLANLHCLDEDKIEASAHEYTEALELYKILILQNSEVYLPYIAGILNNLGSLHCDKNEIELAEQEYREALAIYRIFFIQSSTAYLSNMVRTLINLGFFYLDFKPDRAISLAYIKEVLIIIYPVLETIPYTRKHAQSAVRVLDQWGGSLQDLFEEK